MRDYLRSQTAEAHCQVDGLFGALDLTRPDGYRRFLLAQEYAHSAVSEALQSCWTSPDSPPNPATALRVDLRTMGLSPLPPGAPAATPLCPLGLAYVTIGAHFGTAVLRKHWAQAQCEVVRASGTHFAATTPREFWPKLLELLNAADTGPAARASAAASARLAFELFQTGYHLASEKEDGLCEMTM